MGCRFCATGRRGLSRNLASAEMLWQLVLVGSDFGRGANSAIAMGQGEPLCNYAALAEALGTMSHPKGFDIDARNLIVSTCGIPEGIRRLASDGVPATLAISLHAARQALRDELMPGASAFPLELLREEIVRYGTATGRRASVQYLMLDGVNDADEDLDALEAFCRGLDVFVSLLHFNRIDGIPFSPSTFGRMALWRLELRRRGIEARLNKPRGTDIAAACGQLANRFSSSEA